MLFWWGLHGEDPPTVLKLCQRQHHVGGHWQIFWEVFEGTRYAAAGSWSMAWVIVKKKLCCVLHALKGFFKSFYWFLNSYNEPLGSLGVFRDLFGGVFRVCRLRIDICFVWICGSRSYASQPALDPYLSSLEENGRQTQAMVGCQVCQGRCGSPLADRTPRSGDWMGTRQHPHVDPVPWWIRRGKAEGGLQQINRPYLVEVLLYWSRALIVSVPVLR